MTLLQIVNRVLERLREDPVTTVNETSYSRLIGQFVNDAKQQMEDDWFWSVYETQIDTSITDDGERIYELDATNDRSFMVRRWRDNYPLAFDITDSQRTPLRDMTWKNVREIQNGMNDPKTVERPLWFAIRPNSDGRGFSLELAYGSTTARNWRTYWYIPQNELALDGSDDNTAILLPSNPIYHGAVFMAANERGEEMGEPGNLLERRWHDAKAAAMEIDLQVNKTEEKDMTNLEALRNNIAEAV